MGEIATIVGGSTPRSKEPTYWGGDVPWLAVSDLTGFSEMYISRGARSITQAGFDACAVKMLPAGSVVFSSRAPIGYVAIAANPLCTSQGFKSFVLDEDVDPEYVYWYLKSAKRLAESFASGTTFSELSAKRAARIPISIPSLEEQGVIARDVARKAALLGESRQRLDEAAAAVSVFRRSVMAAGVLGRLSPASQAEEPASDLLDRVLARRRDEWSRVRREQGKKTSSYAEPVRPRPPQGVELPEGWVWATVDQLATRVQYGTSSKTADTGEVPVLRMGNLREGRLALDNLKYLPADHREFPALLLRDGDVLFNRTNSAELVGKAAVYRGEPQKCSFASYLIRVRLDEEIQPELVVYYLSSALGRAWVRTQVSQQVGQANVNGAKLRSLTVPLPPAAVQPQIARSIGEHLSRADEFDRCSEAVGERCDRLTQAIFSAAFLPRAGGVRDGAIPVG